MLVQRRVTPSNKFAGTHLYTRVERGTVRVKCLGQEHNAMFTARARTWTTWSRDERTNHEATAPLTRFRNITGELNYQEPQRKETDRFSTCKSQNFSRNQLSARAQIQVSNNNSIGAILLATLLWLKYYYCKSLFEGPLSWHLRILPYHHLIENSIQQSNFTWCHYETIVKLVSQTSLVGVELFSFVNPFLCLRNLHDYWPRERKRFLTSRLNIAWDHA